MGKELSSLLVCPYDDCSYKHELDEGRWEFTSDDRLKLKCSDCERTQIRVSVDNAPDELITRADKISRLDEQTKDYVESIKSSDDTIGVVVDEEVNDDEGIPVSKISQPKENDDNQKPSPDDAKRLFDKPDKSQPDESPPEETVTNQDTTEDDIMSDEDLSSLPFNEYELRALDKGRKSDLKDVLIKLKKENTELKRRQGQYPGANQQAGLGQQGIQGFQPQHNQGGGMNQSMDNIFRLIEGQANAEAMKNLASNLGGGGARGMMGDFDPQQLMTLQLMTSVIQNMGQFNNQDNGGSLGDIKEVIILKSILGDDGDSGGLDRILTLKAVDSLGDQGPGVMELITAFDKLKGEDGENLGSSLKEIAMLKSVLGEDGGSEFDKVLSAIIQNQGQNQQALSQTLVPLIKQGMESDGGDDVWKAFEYISDHQGQTAELQQKLIDEKLDKLGGEGGGMNDYLQQIFAEWLTDRVEGAQPANDGGASTIREIGKAAKEFAPALQPVVEGMVQQQAAQGGGLAPGPSPAGGQGGGVPPAPSPAPNQQPAQPQPQPQPSPGGQPPGQHGGPPPQPQPSPSPSPSPSPAPNPSGEPESDDGNDIAGVMVKGQAEKQRGKRASDDEGGSGSRAWPQ